MMNSQYDFSKKNQKLQEVNNIWTNEILSHIPKNLEDIAKESKSLQRKRKILSGVDLIKILFLYAVSGISFRMLAAAVKALCISDISDTALRKRLHSSIPFLQELLQNMLSGMVSSTRCTKERNVFLVDGSVLRIQGKEQQQQRVHLCYNLNSNCIAQVKVTDNHTAECLNIFSMKENDIILADAGYGTAKNYAYSQEQKADVILRITPSCFSVFNADGQKYDIYSVLKKAKEQKQKIIEFTGFCYYEKKSYYVRVVAQELSEKEAEQARKRKQRKSQKNHHQIKKETLFFANYVILITSLGAEYMMEEIVYIYRSRWQVELLFKRWKQNLSLNTIRISSKKYAEAMVLLWLIIWILTEKQVLLADRFLKAKKYEQPQIVLTCWTECRCAFLKVKEIISLSWSLFIDLTDNEQRYCLAARNGQRTNQNEEFLYSTLPSFIC